MSWKGFAAVVAALALLGGAHAEGKSKRKPKPRLTVVGFADHQASTGNMPPGGSLNLCAPTAKTVHVYLKYRNFRRGRNTTVKWTLNGASYATAEQKWSLGTEGTAWATMNRAPSQTVFPAGSYRFSFLYSGKRVATTTFTVPRC